MQRLPFERHVEAQRIAAYVFGNAAIVVLIGQLGLVLAGLGSALVDDLSPQAPQIASRVDEVLALVEKERAHRPMKVRPDIVVDTQPDVPVASLAAALDEAERFTPIEALAAADEIQVSAEGAAVAAYHLATSAASHTPDVMPQIASPEIGPITGALPSDILMDLPISEVLATLDESQAVRTSPRKKSAKRAHVDKGAEDDTRRIMASAGVLGSPNAVTASQDLGALGLGAPVKKRKGKRESTHDILSRNLNAYAMATLTP
ncbi:MAG: hypothetical protein NW216_03260 [Hyphomicrobium sp.]|nr:hypothetical protein [Hyphomicrobium sp.]